MTPGQNSSPPWLKAAVGYSDIFGHTLPLNEIIDRIRQIPLQSWIKFVSAVSLVLDRDGYANQATNEQLARTFATMDYRALLTAYLQSKGYLLFSPIALVSLAKLAVAYADESVAQPPVPELEFIFRTYLAVQDHIQGPLLAIDETEPKVTLLRFLVRNVAFAVNPSILDSLTRIWTLFCKYPAEIGSTIDPQQIFQAATGIALPRFFALAFGILARNLSVDTNSSASMASSIPVNQNTLFKNTRAKYDEIRDFFELLTLTQNDIGEIRNEDLNSPAYFYDFTAFRQRPLYRVGGDTLAPLFFPFYRWRITDGLYWDIWWAANNHRRHGLKGINAESFAQAFGYYFEQYIQQLFMRALAEPNTLAQRVWKEPRDTAQAPTADLVIAYPNAYIFIEVKATRFKYVESMVRGDIAAIEDDLRQMVHEPALQLGNAINHFKSGKLAGLGLTWQGQPIFPMIVTYGASMYGVMAKLLRNESWCQELCNQPGVMDLEILNAEEASRLASLAMKGYALVDVLSQKQSSSYGHQPFQNYLIETYGDDSEPRYILTEEWKAFEQMVDQELFGNSEDEANLDVIQ